MRKVVLFLSFVFITSDVFAIPATSTTQKIIKKDGVLCLQNTLVIRDVKGKDFIAEETCDPLPPNFMENMNDQKVRIEDYIRQYNEEKVKP